MALRRIRRFRPAPGADGATPVTDAGSGAPSLLRQRRRRLASIVALAVLSAVIGWLAGRSIRSPDDAARATRPAVASVVSAPVERRVLTSTIVIRGDAKFSSSTDLTVDADLGPQGDRGAGRQVVTGRVPTVGAELTEGSVAVEVSGRPVFLVSGTLPMYRALTPGATGADVRQLEAALARLGFSPGTVDTVYDKRTERAVEQWYRAAGYTPVGPSDQDRDRLTAAEAQVSAAEDVLATARGALARASAGPSHSQVLAAQGEVAVAQAALAQAIVERDEAVAQAPPEDRDRVRREQDLLVLQAQNRLAVAEATLNELTATPDTAAERAAVDRATLALADARTALASLRATVGTRVPRGEVVFLNPLPRRVEQVKAALGAEPSGATLVLSGSDLEIVASVPVTERDRVTVGHQVTIDEDSLGIHLSGVVVAVGEPAGQQEAAKAGTFGVRVRPANARPDTLAGVNVRLTIPIGSTGGEVLAVPFAAVWTVADGTSRVRVVRADGRTDDVTVRVGLSADGHVEVTPADGGLSQGDEVVLGLR